jgi:hypothetical protein
VRLAPFFGRVAGIANCLVEQQGRGVPTLVGLGLHTEWQTQEAVEDDNSIN